MSPVGFPQNLNIPVEHMTGMKTTTSGSGLIQKQGNNQGSRFLCDVYKTASRFFTYFNITSWNREKRFLLPGTDTSSWKCRSLDMWVSSREKCVCVCVFL